MGLKSKPLDAVRQLGDATLSEVSREELVRVNLNVSKSVRKQWKAEAVRVERTLTEIFIEAMEDWMKKVRQP